MNKIKLKILKNICIFTGSYYKNEFIEWHPITLLVRWIYKLSKKNKTMKVSELIKASESLINVFDKANINVSDVRYIPMYEDYKCLSTEGHKQMYIIAYLSDIYNVSEKTVYNIVKKFDKEI